MMKNLIKLMPVMALAMCVNKMQAQWTNGTAVYVTDTTKNVSIGTTTNGANLYVKNNYGSVTMGMSAGLGGNATLFIDKGTFSDGQIEFREEGVSKWSNTVFEGSYAIKNVKDYSTPFKIYAPGDLIQMCPYIGNVVIGSSFDPDHKLHVKGNARIEDGLTVGSPTSGGKIEFKRTGLGSIDAAIEYIKYSSNQRLLISTRLNQPIQLRTNNGVIGLSVINGRVGIFDTVPDLAYRLTVRGDVLIRGEKLALGNKTIKSVGAYETQFSSDVLPTTNGGFFCGTTANRWSAIYAIIGTIQTSDARMKKDIKDLSYGLNEVMKLQPITYKWKDEKLGDDINLGFIAQDLQKVVKEVVVDHTTRYNPETQKIETTKNDVLGVKYSELIPVLVKAIQEQQAQITMQNVKLETVIGENSELKNCIDQLCANNTAKASSPAISANALFQNQPNPFNQTTEIRFALTVDSKSANIIIRNLNGEQIKAIALNQTGKGQVTINANELAQGTYTYTLIVNGESVDTKLMVVTK